MTLERYRQKRDFRATPEPPGQVQPAAGTGGRFVVQKHAARRLHYDFRLEMEGVLKSWAVTRGPSLDPAEKRLAVEVEDHPLDYADFEGTIPKGEYGGGTVIVWDRGRWSPVHDPVRGMKKGHLEFTLEGEKLKGRWHLVRMAARKGEARVNWLLIKGEDAEARGADAPDILDDAPQSVLTGRDLEAVARGDPAPDPVPAPDPGAISGAKRADFPGFVPPMLATLVAKAPDGEDWWHEIKFDGYRLQVLIRDGRVQLMTRGGLDWSETFGPDLPAALADLPCAQAILDGELVVEAGNGASNFTQLQADLSAGRTDRFLLYLFDLLYLDGFDLRRAALADRKAALERLLDRAPDRLRLSAHFREDGAMMLRHACRLSLEGIVSKRADAPYRSGRGRGWLKSKCAERQEFVVAGYVPSTVLEGAVGSLILGVQDKGGLRYVGRVGTGFTQGAARDLFARLHPLRQQESPFAAPLTATQRRGVVMVRPELVAEVEFRAWTGDHHLRHAAFRGLRADKPASQVVDEGAARPPAAPEREARRRVRLTHPDRVYWPDRGITKAALADYYAEVWPQIAPHVVNRPLALLRCPDGITGPSFFQKHVWKGLNPAILQVADPKAPGDPPLVAVGDLDGLLGLVQAAALEIHPWGATLADWDRPDRIVMDLDPGPDVPWMAVIEAAEEVRVRLQDAGLAGFVKTSGGKGLHVVAPLEPAANWPEVKAFTQGLARAMGKDSPDRYVATITKSKRQGRILIDYLRNQRGATAVAAFSTRARAGAPVSTPLDWGELGPDIGPAHFTLGNLPARLQALDRDPWADFLRAARPLRSG